MIRFRWCFVALALAGMVPTMTVAAPKPSRFITLDAPNVDADTYPNRINNHGQIVGLGGGQGFLFSDGVYTVPRPPWAVSRAVAPPTFTAINDRGQVVGAYEGADGHTHGFLLSHGTYTPIDFPHAQDESWPTGINSEGQVVGYYDDADVTHAFLFSDGRYRRIDPPASRSLVPSSDAEGATGVFRDDRPQRNVVISHDVEATGLNDKGQVVGVYLSNTGPHGYLLSHGVYTLIDFPRAGSTSVSCINDAGQVLGQAQKKQALGQASSVPMKGTWSFVWSHGVYTKIEYPQAIGTEASSINNSGQIIGDYEDVQGQNHGFLFSHGVYATIDFPGALNTAPASINDSGQVVGSYRMTNMRINDQKSSRFPTHGFLRNP